MTSIEQVRGYYNATLPFYDLSLEDRGDLPFWTAIARRWNARHILDLGCGTGRITSVLSTIAPTTAVDLLVEMLRRAQQRAPRARFVAADLRELAFAAKFDLVILADDPMAHLTSAADRVNALRRIAALLAPEGRVVLEGLYRPAGKESHKPPRAIVGDGVRLFTVAETWTAAEERDIWNVAYRYEEKSDVTEVKTILRSWSAEEIDRIGETGLEVEALWGDFDESPFSPGSSRVVIVAKGRTWR